MSHARPRRPLTATTYPPSHTAPAPSPLSLTNVPVSNPQFPPPPHSQRHPLHLNTTVPQIHLAFKHSTLLVDRAGHKRPVPQVKVDLSHEGPCDGTEDGQPFVKPTVRSIPAALVEEEGVQGVEFGDGVVADLTASLEESCW